MSSDQPPPRGDDGVEHRLDVCRRSTDDAQDVAGRHLLLEEITIRRRRSATVPSNWRPALKAKLGVGGIVLLAPGTRHAGASKGDRGARVAGGLRRVNTRSDWRRFAGI